ncbi:MAG: tetratricopeptide repeat protein [Microcoleus sp.]|uniref:tetratricopeptide repeat protein n=1 Tax=Microcoleus sp. TaxID=44472 RepID=UPI003C7344D8
MLDSDIVDYQSINEDSYDGLVSLIEASKGVLSLLIASCKPGDFQTQIINRYEAELVPNIPCYRVVLNQKEPSLRAALEQLVKDCPELKEPHASAAITVTGTEALMEFVSQADSNHRSELDRFFGYLQWTREGLREFPYPIVIWVTPNILSRLSREAPDFWSWRSGVFRFVSPAVEATDVINQTWENSTLIELETKLILPLDELLEQVENLEQQAMETPALATLYNRVARAYANRLKTRQTQNYSQERDLAIDFFHKSLALQQKLNLLRAQSDTLLGLGDLYYTTADYSRIVGSRAENLERAIAFYEAALTVYTLEDFPEDWAMTQNNLANAYRNRINGLRADNLERAIAFYEAALTVRTLEDFPEQWAMTQNNLANAYLYRINGSRAQNLEQAIAFYEATLKVRTLEDFPEDWAMTQNNLGEAYRYRIKGSPADNLERAIAFYEAALTVRTLEDFPEDWAMTQNNLGEAYSDRIKGSRADNLERAIDFYEAALTVRTLEDFPEKWAMTQNNLALAYANRINGSRADNLEKAIASYNAALTIYTRDAFPENWAMTQNNLGLAYSDRIRGDKAQNIELAKKCYENALTVRTFEAFPQEYTETLFNLGNLDRSNQ